MNVNKNYIAIIKKQVICELQHTWRNAKQVQLQLIGWPELQ